MISLSRLRLSGSNVLDLFIHFVTETSTIKKEMDVSSMAGSVGIGVIVEGGREESAEWDISYLAI